MIVVSETGYLGLCAWFGLFYRTKYLLLSEPGEKYGENYSVIVGLFCFFMVGDCDANGGFFTARQKILACENLAIFM